MELRTTSRLQRSDQLSKTVAKQGEVSAKVKAQPSQKQAPTDNLTLSRQALAYLEEQNRQRWEKAQEKLQRDMAQTENLLNGLDNANDQIDAMTKALKVLLTCQKISASIIKGDNVPPEDIQYLIENDPEGYKMAIALRRPKDDPEDCESVLDDEDKNRSTQQSGVGEAPSISAPEAASGGGEASAPAE